jgi:hypothetical protein
MGAAADLSGHGCRQKTMAQEILENQKLPSELISKKIWKERFDDIRNYERYLTRNGIAFRKFFLHISKSEHVVPANSKWFARLVVAGAVIAALEEMDLAYPKVDREKRKELQAAREALESQD